MKNKAKVNKNMKKELKTKKSFSDKNGNKIIPLNDRVVVRPFSGEDSLESQSGIIIPETVSKEKPEQGIVIAVGEGRWDDGERVPMSVKVGDKVVFSRYGYDDIKVDGEEYYILKEENILAIIR